MVFMVLVNWPQSVLCVCEFVCYQIRIPVKKKPHGDSDLNKLDVLQHKTHTKCPSGTNVARLVMYRSIDPYYHHVNLAHQMCCDLPCSQRNITTQRAVGLELEVTGKWGQVGGQNLKR